MRIATAALSAVALTLGVAAPALAHPASAVLPPINVDLTHQATDNVGFVARLPEHAGSAGGVLTSNDAVEDLFVITDPRGLFTYDVTDARNPVLLDFIVVNQARSGTGAALAQEDPSTDGEIVLVDGVNEDGVNGMQIVSIADPSNLEILGTYSGTDHTWVCVTDVNDPADPSDDDGCAYAYGRSDNIIDITDPANPVKLEGWKTQLGDSAYTHDLTEIRPGLVMSAGAKPVLMDTTDPAEPIELVRVDENDHAGFGIRNFPSLGYHSVEWAREGADDFLVMGTEIAPSGSTNLAGSDCEGENSVIETWDATDVREALAAYDEAITVDGLSREAAADLVFGANRDAVNFHLLDFYDATGRGLFVNGQTAAHVLYCAHWMEVDPRWENGGRLVVGYYNRGVRFVDVASDGTMEEAGWFLGADAYTGSAQWVTDGIVYVSDYARGLDIVEITDAEATGTYTADSALANRAMTMAQLDTFGIAPAPEHGVPTGAFVAAGLGLLAAAALRRRSTATVEHDA